MLDCLVVVPFEPATAPVLDPHMRSTYLAHVAVPLEAATVELEHYLGVRLNYWESGMRPTISGRELALPKTRTLSAVVLSSALEHAGLRWRALDPGVRELDWWRRELKRSRGDSPLTVAVCTTFVMHYPWLHAFCRLIRHVLPHARLLIGGYYYASNAANFLSLDADVYCVGEGEVRLPEIVHAIRADRALDHIRGLYVRGPQNAIRYTGHAEFLDLRARPPVDWSLAPRIEPHVTLDDLFEVGVETQRGCVFKCEFCSYRTLTPPNALDPEAAADAIMAARVARNAAINIVDATASFPHERWKAILRALIARGGAPHPIWAFARVSDINDESAALMAAAGVRHLFVGQESGDQRILDAMKKGTKVTHVRPAVEALAAHGVSATFGFIHGFPGETTETIAATRRLIASLNDGFAERPPVVTYLLYPFTIPALAAVAARDEFRDVQHYLDYNAAGMDPERTLGEVLETIVMMSRVPHAPAFSHLLLKSVMPTTGATLFSRHDRTDLFRWFKAVERGVAIFLERELAGTRPNDAELRELRRTILAAYPSDRPKTPLLHRATKPLLNHLQREWRGEPQRGAGMVTRAWTAATITHQTRDVPLGWRALRGADIAARPVATAPVAQVQEHALNLVLHARTTTNKYPKQALPTR
jgi:hypothetical protein